MKKMVYKVFLFLLICLSISLNIYSQSYQQITICRNNLNLHIPEPVSVKDSIYFPHNWNFITDVNVIIDTVFHTWVSQLAFHLLHRGRIAKLIYNAGGSGDNFINTKLDDSAGITINQGSAPFSGNYRLSLPDSLKLFTGSNNDASGYWIIAAVDSYGADTGNLRAWCIQVSGFFYLGVNQISSEIPENFELFQNYPNPFNPTTKIRFNIPSLTRRGAGVVVLKVYDALGREVQTLVNEQIQPGTYEVDFPAPTGDGSNYSSGVYYYTLSSGDYIETKKMVLMK